MGGRGGRLPPEGEPCEPCLSIPSQMPEDARTVRIDVGELSEYHFFVETL